MTDYCLPPHIHFCLVDGRRVFLDLSADRYFMLPPDLEPDLAALTRGEQPRNVGRLLGLGLLISGPGRPVAPTRFERVEDSLTERAGTGPRPSPAAIGEAWARVAAARRGVAAGRLAALLADMPACPQPTAPCPDLERAVMRFVAARRYVPVEPGCLHDSLALGFWLKRRRLGARLVIGVKLHPFGAHCWLQAGGVVLNDSLAAALGFEPVLVA